MPPVFISYSRKQEDWVWSRLVPVLKAGGGEILIDREQFEAARAVYRQMDEVQDRAALNILVLSPEYLASKACQHEMKRAIARDPDFKDGVAVPVLRVDCPLPPSIAKPDPLHVDLRDDTLSDPWDLLLKKCQIDIGIAAPDWLHALNKVIRHLKRGDSVNLVVTGRAEWRALLNHLGDDPKLALRIVKLDSAEALTRPLLVQQILKKLNCPDEAVPRKPLDLVLLSKRLKQKEDVSRLALTAFHLVSERKKEYGLDFFVTLRDLMMDARKLVLLIESRVPFVTLLPDNHPLSEIQIVTVELKGRP